MKVIFCLKCGDIRAMDPTGLWSSCACGNIMARWRDPRRGTVDVKRTSDPSTTRFIGLNNTFLFSSLVRWNGLGMHEDWRNLHESVAIASQGYIFHESMRNCWACIIPVGATNDIDWYNEPDTKEEVAPNPWCDNLPEEGTRHA